jgi:hypothetical protein
MYAPDYCGVLDHYRKIDFAPEYGTSWGRSAAALQRQGLCKIERCKNVHHEAYAEVKRLCLGLHHRPFLMMQVITQMMLHHHQRALAICVDYAAFWRA